MGVEVSDSELDKFADFEKRLYRANEHTNLTRVPRDECRTRHFLDSLSLSSLIPSGSSVIDLGTGAGFPGVPLAIARKDLRVTLLDSASKEIRFLESLSDLAPLGLILGRAEEVGRDPAYREQYDICTGRAFAPLPIQAEVSAAFVKTAGLFLPQRASGEATPEFVMLGMELVRRADMVIGGIDRRVPVYRKVSPVEDRFPRSWSAMKKRPLG
jgi:16S rRNA (guanine527-N7)-methyltransferase